MRTINLRLLMGDAPVNDKFQEFGRKILLHMDRSVLAALAVLLAILLALFFIERSHEVQPLADLQALAFEEMIPNPNYNHVVDKYLNLEPDISKNPSLRPLIEFNMFDLKEVKAQEELEKQYDEQAEQASRLIQSGKKTEALKMLDSILARKPNHVRSLDLRKQLVPPTPEPTPSPTAKS